MAYMNNLIHSMVCRLVVVVGMVLCALPASAQLRIEGTVVDLHGNPIAKAHVEVTQLRQGTDTDSEGHFVLELTRMPRELRVSHPDFVIRTVAPKAEMRIRLQPRVAEPWLEEARHPFVGLGLTWIGSPSGQMSPIGNQRGGTTVRTVSVMGGLIEGQYGGYLRAGILPINSSDAFEISSKRNAMHFTVGALYRAYGPFYAHLGVGALFCKERTTTFGEIHEYSDFGRCTGIVEKSLTRPVVDFGVVGRYTHYMVSLSMLTSFHAYEWHPAIGVAYIF